MHVVIADTGIPSYLEALRGLLRQGPRRVLLRGDARLCGEILAAAGAQGLTSAGLEVTVCGEAGGPQHVSHQEASARAWDAVLLCPGPGESFPVRDLAPRELAGNLVYPGARPPFVGVVAIHKSGTNLLAGLLRALGYQVIGQGVTPPWPRPAPGLAPRDREWEYLSVPPADCAYVTHSLPLFTGDDREPRPLLKLWCERRFPLLFHYRDPRAVLCSFVRYVLKDHHSGEFTESPFTKVCAETLSAVPDPAARLTLALQILGEYMTWAFRDNAWLLHHPTVCKTRYETLAGPEAGGDRAAQVLDVARVMMHLAAPGDPETLAAGIYERQARTFAVGRCDSWKEELGPEHRRLFELRYGDLLAAFGYSVADA